ncbi:MAG: AAA family ATPase, partial [Geminicoccaceae bacterium]
YKTPPSRRARTMSADNLIGFRTPPSNIDSEQALLGSILCNNKNYRLIEGIVKAEHFYEPVHRRIYQRMAGMIEWGRGADFITMKREFDEDDALKQVNGADYLNKMTIAAELVLSPQDYAIEVRDLAIKRALIAIGTDSANIANDPKGNETGADLLISLEHKIETLKESHGLLSDLSAMKAAELAEADPAEREWLIDDWLPVGCVTSFYGDGGVGKSLAALQASIAIANGTEFYGMQTIQAPVLGFFCEDDQAELHRRLYNCCEGMDVDIAKLTNLHWSSRCGASSNLLATIGPDGALVKTPTYMALRKLAMQLKARVLVLDNISHLFAGNENDRAEVTQFINLMNDLALAINGSVLLLGHTAKAEGSEYSGSTSWNNAVRSRWLLSKPKPDDEDDDEDVANARILTKAKSNYTRTGDEILIEWERGAFKRKNEDMMNFMDTLERRSRDSEIDRKFLHYLHKLADEGRAVSDVEGTKNYAPKVFKKIGEMREFKLAEIRASMERLFADGKIMANQPVAKGADRHTRYGIAIK